ncbi:uncharacterized protein LOC130719241 [Lotus japonicus]|uniref:uncharacterized protein LOC130719241 n=1 Tax=Lotus japonicus TaxID=34305 RepID=UPI002585A83F|nr:uncharacterized protein LOC130719241 [Lotus japonicus]
MDLHRKIEIGLGFYYFGPKQSEGDTCPVKRGWWRGCKIHASVRKTLIYRFQSLLSEGHVYQISFFGVGESGRDFRPTSHPFKINFDIHTYVRLVPNKAINLSPYNFVPLSNIMFKDLDTSFLIDVIGILTGASAEQEFEKDDGKQKIITILHPF